MADPMNYFYVANQLTTPENQSAVNKAFDEQYEKYQQDTINHPAHYKAGGVETIDFIEAKQLGYHLGNVVKYISRAGIKSHCPIEDLKKAQWYLNRYVELLQKGDTP